MEFLASKNIYLEDFLPFFDFLELFLLFPLEDFFLVVVSRTRIFLGLDFDFLDFDLLLLLLFFLRPAPLIIKVYSSSELLSSSLFM